MVLSAESEVAEWEDAPLEVQKLLNLGYCPRIIMLTNKRALLDLKSLGDRDKVLSLSFLSLQGVKVVLSSWSPGVDTLSSSWFRQKTRWITFVGIPYHLLTFEIMESLCRRFGVMKGFDKIGLEVGKLLGARVKVDMCDVRFIPHFEPLVDLGGVVYPVRILIDDFDVGEVEQSHDLQASVSVARSEGQRRSYSEVASSNWHSKKVIYVWRSGGSNYVNSPIPSKVAETALSNEGG